MYDMEVLGPLIDGIVNWTLEDSVHDLQMVKQLKSPSWQLFLVEEGSCIGRNLPEC